MTELDAPDVPGTETPLPAAATIATREPARQPRTDAGHVHERTCWWDFREARWVCG